MRTLQSGPAIRVVAYRSTWQRARGLIGRPSPAPGCGVLLENCRQVHTFFMHYAVDTVHLARNGQVLAVRTLAPWRIGTWRWDSTSVLELAAGEAERLGLFPGMSPILIDRDSRVTPYDSTV